jgi:hypothetical protein
MSSHRRLTSSGQAPMRSLPLRLPATAQSAALDFSAHSIRMPHSRDIELENTARTDPTASLPLLKVKLIRTQTIPTDHQTRLRTQPSEVLFMEDFSPHLQYHPQSSCGTLSFSFPHCEHAADMHGRCMHTATVATCNLVAADVSLPLLHHCRFV